MATLRLNSSLQSQVMAFVVAAVAIPGAPAYRVRMTAFEKEDLPATNVLPEEGDARYTDADSTDRSFRFRLRHMAQAVDQADAVVDPLYVAAHKALMADRTLGGLVSETRELSQKWSLDKGEVETVALEVLYEVEFFTGRSDPSRPPFS